MATKFGTALIKSDNSFQAGLESARRAMEKAGVVDVDLSVVFASSKYDYQEVVQGVRTATGNAPLIGCSTAGEFTEERTEKGGVACAVISSDTHRFFPFMGKGLKSDETRAIQEAGNTIPTMVEGYPFQSAILLIDGLAGKGEETVLSALSVLGPNVKFSGGAAADDLKGKETMVFVGDETATDAVSLTLVASQVPLAIGVMHGHCPLSPPLTITRANGNIVYELDGGPAFDVWKEWTREPAGRIGIDVDSLSSEQDIMSFLTQFEAGLMTGNGYKIRWPSALTPDGGIVFPSLMSEGMVVRVMESHEDEQIASARRAAEIALNACRGAKIAGAIVFDCACRSLILKDSFQKAVSEITDVLRIPLIGFETYGEIAMEIGQLSGFHNTTTVVLLFPE